MAKLFVAYARLDAPMVDRLVRAVETEQPQIDLWYSEREVQPGEDARQAMLQALRRSDSMLYCATAATGEVRPGALLAEEEREALRRRADDAAFRILVARMTPNAIVPDGLAPDEVLDFSNPSSWRARILDLSGLILEEDVDVYS